MELKDIATIAALIIGILTFLHTRFQVEAGLRERINKTEGLTRVHEDDIKELEARVPNKDHIASELTEFHRRMINIEAVISRFGQIETKVDVFWEIVREYAPKMLMHHDEMERDILIAKLKSRNITQDEARQLKALLQVELEHEVKSEEWWPAVLNLVDVEYVIRGLK